MSKDTLNFLKFGASSIAKESGACRFRQMLSNEHLISAISVANMENGRFKVGESKTTATVMQFGEHNSEAVTNRRPCFDHNSSKSTNFPLPTSHE